MFYLRIIDIKKPKQKSIEVINESCGYYLLQINPVKFSNNLMVGYALLSHKTRETSKHFLTDKDILQQHNYKFIRAMYFRAKDREMLIR